jgi:CheB methylesterase
VGFESISALLAGIPARTGMAYVFVQHLDPGHGSYLAKILSNRATACILLEKIPRNMSDEYFYVRFRFSPKIGVRTAPSTRQHEAVVEVPRNLVQRKKLDYMNENPREKAIALDFARRAALALFSTGEQGLAWPYDEDALWCEDRHPVMKERPCDCEHDGIRAWRIPIRNRFLDAFDP